MSFVETEVTKLLNLLVVGFLLETPLLVLALAKYCRLARQLQLGLSFIKVKFIVTCTNDSVI